ncbi:DUF4093 domain-containing protein, partial [Bifidobacterium pseudocatenulatum]
GDKNARARRERLGQLLGIGYGNAKQMQKRLNMFRISQEQFENAIEKINQEEKSDEQ